MSVNRDGFYVHMQTVRSAFTAHRASTGQAIVRGLALSQATAEVEGRGQKARLALRRRKRKTKLPRLVLAEHAYVEAGGVYLDCLCEATSMTKCGV